MLVFYSLAVLAHHQLLTVLWAHLCSNDTCPQWQQWNSFKWGKARIFADTLLFIRVRATADLSVLKFGIQFLPFIVFLNRVAEQKEHVLRKERRKEWLKKILKKTIHHFHPKKNLTSGLVVFSSSRRSSSAISWERSKWPLEFALHMH